MIRRRPTTEAEIQKALDEDAGAILPDEPILISRGLRIPSERILEGSGWRTCLVAAHGFEGTMLAVTVQPASTDGELEIQGVGVERLRLRGNNLPGCTGIAYGADPLIRSSQPRTCWFERLRIERCGTPVVVDTVEGGVFSEVKLVKNLGPAVMRNANGVAWTNCDIRQNLGEGLVVDGRANPSSECRLTSVHFESNDGPALIGEGMAGWLCQRVKFEDNRGHIVLTWSDRGRVELRPDHNVFDGVTLNATRGGNPGILVFAGTRLEFRNVVASAKLVVALRFAGAGAGDYSLVDDRGLRKGQLVGAHSLVTVTPGGSIR